jgi:hypothetical protein
MSTTNLPDLSSIHLQIAQQSQCVNETLDSLDGSLDHIANAASLRDWNQVLQISKTIKKMANLQGEQLIAEAAEDIIHTLPHSNDTDNLRRVIRLLGASGQTKKSQHRI